MTFVRGLSVPVQIRLLIGLCSTLFCLWVKKDNATRNSIPANVSPRYLCALWLRRVADVWSSASVGVQKHRGKSDKSRGRTRPGRWVFVWFCAFMSEPWTVACAVVVCIKRVKMSISFWMFQKGLPFILLRRRNIYSLICVVKHLH